MNVFEALRARFAPPAWVYLEEVRNAPGWPSTLRTADGLAMSVWASRGLELEGVEVKVSRSDWLKELRRPDKADPIFEFCDRWWLAVPELEIVKPGELPKPWGLLVPKGESLIVHKEAPKLKPKPISRGLLAMMLRAAVARPAPDEAIIARRVEEKVEKDREFWTEQGRRESAGLRRSHDALTAAVQDFQKKSGVTIHAYDGGQIGDAVNMVLTGAHRRIPAQLQEMKRIAGFMLDQIDRALTQQPAEPEEELEETA